VQEIGGRKTTRVCRRQAALNEEAWVTLAYKDKEVEGMGQSVSYNYCYIYMPALDGIKLIHLL
jgi:hypothetical protein